MRQAVASRRNETKISARLFLSYIFDWIVIIAAAGIATWLANIAPNKRHFSLGNADISYPYGPDTVSSTVLILVSCLAPAAIIVFVCLILVPGPTVPKSVPKSLIWKRKLWEWFTGWLGLGMSCAGAWLITSGLKNLVGKPRPDMLDRCKPDLVNLAKYVLTGFPSSPAGTSMVSHLICTQTDAKILDDGWRSWPSGHSSFSAAGLIYLSLFLASKLAITVPFLSHKNGEGDAYELHSAFPSRNNSRLAPISAYPPLPRTGSRTEYSGKSSASEQKIATNLDRPTISARNQAASPPIYLLAICFLPTAVSMFIASSRYPDFRHSGWDILSGYTIGVANAFWAFRYYHLPIARGAGWSWGPRSASRAWWAGIGVGSYVGDEEGDRKRRDEEAAIGEAVMMDDMMDPGSANRADDLSRDRAELNSRSGAGGSNRSRTEMRGRRETDEFELLERGNSGGGLAASDSFSSYGEARRLRSNTSETDLSYHGAGEGRDLFMGAGGGSGSDMGMPRGRVPASPPGVAI